MATIHIGARDAETGAPVPTFQHKGKLARPTALVIPVAQPFDATTALGWAEALDSANSPLGPDGPADVAVVGAPGGPPLDAMSGQVAGYAGMRLFRVDEGGLT